MKLYHGSPKSLTILKAKKAKGLDYQKHIIYVRSPDEILDILKN